jgi:hypothetical protein
MEDRQCRSDAESSPLSLGMRPWAMGSGSKQAHERERGYMLAVQRGLPPAPAGRGSGHGTGVAQALGPRDVA